MQPSHLVQVIQLQTVLPLGSFRASIYVLNSKSSSAWQPAFRPPVRPGLRAVFGNLSTRCYLNSPFLSFANTSLRKGCAECVLVDTNILPQLSGIKGVSRRVFFRTTPRRMCVSCAQAGPLRVVPESYSARFRSARMVTLAFKHVHSEAARSFHWHRRHRHERHRRDPADARDARLRLRPAPQSDHRPPGPNGSDDLPGPRTRPRRQCFSRRYQFGRQCRQSRSHRGPLSQDPGHSACRNARPS